MLRIINDPAASAIAYTIIESSGDTHIVVLEMVDDMLSLHQMTISRKVFEEVDTFGDILSSGVESFKIIAQCLEDGLDKCIGGSASSRSINGWGMSNVKSVCSIKFSLTDLIKMLDFS